MYEEEKLRLSKTGVLTYLTCPKKYYYQFVEKLIPEEQEQMVLGKKLHIKYESFYRLIPIEVDEQKIREVFENTCLPKEKISEYKHLQNFLEMNLNTFKDLKSKNLLQHFKPIAIEEKYYDEELDFVGVIDAVFKIDGNTLLVDWKTSNYKEGKESEYRFELAGYRHLWEKFYPTIPITHWGVFFSGDGTFWVEEVMEKSMKAFYEKLEYIRSKIKTKQFEKAKNALCQYCGYFDVCWEKQQYI